MTDSVWEIRLDREYLAKLREKAEKNAAATLGGFACAFPSSKCASSPPNHRGGVPAVPPTVSRPVGAQLQPMLRGSAPPHHVTRQTPLLRQEGALAGGIGSAGLRSRGGEAKLFASAEAWEAFATARGVCGAAGRALPQQRPGCLQGCLARPGPVVQLAGPSSPPSWG